MKSMEIKPGSSDPVLFLAPCKDSKPSCKGSTSFLTCCQHYPQKPSKSTKLIKFNENRWNSMKSMEIKPGSSDPSFLVGAAAWVLKLDSILPINSPNQRNSWNSMKTDEIWWKPWKSCRGTQIQPCSLLHGFKDPSFLVGAAAWVLKPDSILPINSPNPRNSWNSMKIDEIRWNPWKSSQGAQIQPCSLLLARIQGSNILSCRGSSLSLRLG